MWEFFCMVCLFGFSYMGKIEKDFPPYNWKKEEKGRKRKKYMWEKTSM